MPINVYPGANAQQLQALFSGGSDAGFTGYGAGGFGGGGNPNRTPGNPSLYAPGVNDTPSTAELLAYFNANKVPGISQKPNAQRFSSLLQSYALGEPTALDLESMFKPGFVDTSLNTLNTTLGGTGGQPGLVSNISELTPLLAYLSGSTNVNTAAALVPGASAAVRGVNPGQTGLLDQLTRTASTNLAAGTTLLPSDVNNITNSVRGDWANRGLGVSAPAQLDEALQLYGGGQQTLAARQAAAGSAANLDQMLTNPAWALANSGQGSLASALGLTQFAGNYGAGAGPTLLTPQEMYDLFNTQFNATAASNLAGQNNSAAIEGAIIGAVGQAAGGATSAFSFL